MLINYCLQMIELNVNIMITCSNQWSWW